MKRKLTSEEAHLWQAQLVDVKQLPKVTLEPTRPKSRRVPKVSKTSLQTAAPITKKLTIPIFLPPPQTFNRKEFRRVHIDARLDLHGMSCEKAYNILKCFLLQAQEKRYKTVLIITGKGALSSENTLRRQLPRWLEDTPLRQFVASYHHPVKAQDGGAGAYYVKVKAS